MILPIGETINEYRIITCTSQVGKKRGGRTTVEIKMDQIGSGTNTRDVDTYQREPVLQEEITLKNLAWGRKLLGKGGKFRRRLRWPESLRAHGKGLLTNFVVNTENQKKTRETLN